MKSLKFKSTIALLATIVLSKGSLATILPIDPDQLKRLTQDEKTYNELVLTTGKETEGKKFDTLFELREIYKGIEIHNSAALTLPCHSPVLFQEKVGYLEKTNPVIFRWNQDYGVSTTARKSTNPTQNTVLVSPYKCTSTKTLVGVEVHMSQQEDPRSAKVIQSFDGQHSVSVTDYTEIGFESTVWLEYNETKIFDYGDFKVFLTVRKVDKQVDKP